MGISMEIDPDGGGGGGSTLDGGGGGGGGIGERDGSVIRIPSLIIRKNGFETPSFSEAKDGFTFL